MRLTALFAVAVAGCGGPMHDPQYVQGFDPGPAPAGYTRIVTPPHTLQPGDNVNYCEFVAGPSDKDQDILGSQGYQGVAGHHLSLYGTKDTKTPVGTTRPCTSDDMLVIQFIGAVGGEGVNTDVVKLPPGVAFRLPKGMALMSNTHYINASSKVVQTQSVVDVHFTDVSPNVTPLGAFTLHSDGFQIPNGGQPWSYEAQCTVDRDLPIILAANHMHDSGTSMTLEVIHADMTKTTIVTDPVWHADQGFNPRWEHWALDAPLVVHAGETVHQTCTWTNKSDHVMGFPEEMCDGATYWLNGIDAIYCRGG